MVYLHALLNMGHSWPLFLHFSLFNTVDGKCSMTFFADDWIWIVDLWFWKWPLYQLSHCQCPTFILWLHLQKNKWDLNLNHHSALTSRAPTRPYLYFLLAELQLNVFLVHLSLLAPPRWTPPPVFPTHISLTRAKSQQQWGLSREQPEQSYCDIIH